MSVQTLISQAKFEISADKGINEFFDELAEGEWEKVRVTLFHAAERRCLKSGLKLFKHGVEKQINTFGKEDVCIQYTSLNLTDYSPACDKTMDEYAAGVFKDEKIKKMMEKKGLFAVQTGVREMFSRDTTTKEIKERVDVIYAVIVTKKMVANIMAKRILHKLSEPAKSNAPSPKNFDDEDLEVFTFNGEELLIGVESGFIFRQVKNFGDIKIGIAGQGKFKSVKIPSPQSNAPSLD